MSRELQTRFALVAALLLALCVLVFEMLRPYLYLAPDSFTYFDMARQFAQHGMLFSYSGLDHTTGIHPGWYFLLLPFYPLFGMQLPVWSFVIGAILILAGTYALYRSAGPMPAAVVLLAALTPYGATLTNNGMESPLLFSGLCLLAAFFLQERELTPRRALLLGVLLSLVVVARLDAIFVVAAIFLLLLLRRTDLRTLFLIVLPLLGALLGVFALNFHYGGSILPLSGALKSSFPRPTQDWLANLSALKIYPLSILAIGLYLLYRRGAGRQLGVLVPALFIACASLWAYDALFVSDIGKWYGTLPFFCVALVAGLLLTELLAVYPVMKDLRITAAAGMLAALVVLGMHVVARGTDWITPHQQAAQWLALRAQPGEAAAEFKDGVFAFYASMPVYNLTGLANNRAYIDALKQGSLAQYLSERRVTYIIGGTFGSRIQVPGAKNDLTCHDPVFDAGAAAIYTISDCTVINL